MIVTTVLISIGTIAVLGFAALLLSLYVAERNNRKRTQCRACSAPITNGGVCFYPLGCGFCHKCASELLIHQRKGDC